MTTLREAAELALEALENHSAIKHPQQRYYRDEAIQALKEALKQPVFDCPRCGHCCPQPAIIERAEEAFAAAQNRGWVGVEEWDNNEINNAP